MASISSGSLGAISLLLMLTLRRPRHIVIAGAAAVVFTALAAHAG